MIKKSLESKTFCENRIACNILIRFHRNVGGKNINNNIFIDHASFIEKKRLFEKNRNLNGAYRFDDL